MVSFNPYHKWLGIQPQEQPASYYRLFGIGEFESDADVIEGTAERQAVYLRSFQTGSNSELAERLLDEVSEARVGLLTAEDQARHDQQLQASQQPAQPVAEETVPEEAPVPLVTPQRSVAAKRSSTRTQSRRRLAVKPLWQQPWVMATAGVVAVVLLPIFFNSGGNEPQPAGGQHGTTSAKVDPTPKVPNKKTEEEQQAELERPVEERVKEELAQAEQERLATAKEAAAAKAVTDKAAAEKLAAEEAYERAVRLIQGATTIANPEARGKQLDRAEKLIKEIVEKNAQHPLRTKANSQLGNLLQLRARGNVKLATSPAQRNRKAELLKMAYAQYEESHKAFQAAREAIKKQLEGMKAALNPETQQEEITARNELRREYLQLQLLGALILEETADTLEPGSAEFKKVLADAAKQFDEIGTKYRSLYAGIYSRACQGRCHKKLGQLNEALGCFSKILQLPDNPAFREVKTVTLVLATECWLDASQKKYSQAIQQGSVWIEGMRPNETDKPAWLKMRLLLAEAHLLWADELKAKNPRDKQVLKSQDQARKLARDVARFSGDYQDQARALLARLPDGDSARIKEDDPSQK